MNPAPNRRPQQTYPEALQQQLNHQHQQHRLVVPQGQQQRPEARISWTDLLGSR